MAAAASLVVGPVLRGPAQTTVRTSSITLLLHACSRPPSGRQPQWFLSGTFRFGGARAFLSRDLSLASAVQQLSHATRAVTISCSNAVCARGYSLNSAGSRCLPCGGFRKVPCVDDNGHEYCNFTPDDAPRTAVNNNGVCVPCGSRGRTPCSGMCP